LYLERSKVPHAEPAPWPGHTEENQKCVNFVDWYICLVLLGFSFLPFQANQVFPISPTNTEVTGE
jgi:hypothetical protein